MRHIVNNIWRKSLIFDPEWHFPNKDLHMLTIYCLSNAYRKIIK